MILEIVTESNINYYKNLAKNIKKTLEADKNETWNCIVGTDYGAWVSYEKGNLIYFRLNELYFLFFRFGSDSNK
jgi:hypothetical protein